MEIREAANRDSEEIAALFYETVHAVNCRDYSPEQIDAWTGPEKDVQRWADRQDTRKTFVAEDKKEIIGFAELELDGHIDCFYTHKEWQGRGVGSALLNAICAEARRLHLPRLFVEASITARPFFERRGFVVVLPQEVERRGVKFRNYKMDCVL